MLRIPGSWSLSFSDPKTAPKEEGGKKFFVLKFFDCRKFHKIVNTSIFEHEKKFFSQNTKYYNTFYQKIYIKLSEIYWFGIRDPGSRKNLFQILEPGSKRHRIPDPDAQLWWKHSLWVWLIWEGSAVVTRSCSMRGKLWPTMRRWRAVEPSRNCFLPSPPSSRKTPDRWGQFFIFLTRPFLLVTVFWPTLSELLIGLTCLNAYPPGIQFNWGYFFPP